MVDQVLGGSPIHPTYSRTEAHSRFLRGPWRVDPVDGCFGDPGDSSLRYVTSMDICWREMQ